MIFFSSLCTTATSVSCFHCCLRLKLAVFSTDLLLVVTLKHLPEAETCGNFLHQLHTLVSFIMKHTCDSVLVFNCISIAHVCQSHRASARQRSVPSLASSLTCLLVFLFSTQELCMTVPPGEGSTWSRDTTLFLTLARRARRSFCRVNA